MTFKEIILAMHGEEGRQWLERLPALLSQYAELWALTLSEPFKNLSYNYVISVRREDGSSAVLKVGFPNDEFRAEVAALKQFDGQGAVRVLEADIENCAMLLERIVPGETLWDVKDEVATARLLDVMPKLWKPYHGNYPFKSVADWGQGFARLRERHHGGTGSLDSRMVDKAERLFSELIETSAPPVLLHGDFHHDNVLSNEGGSYVAIDPKGVLGEPCYETGAFLRNPFPSLLKKENPRELTQRRVDKVVERLGLDRQRVIGWGFAQAVLSAIWCDEDDVDCAEGMMQVAEILEEFL